MDKGQNRIQWKLKISNINELKRIVEMLHFHFEDASATDTRIYVEVNLPYDDSSQLPKELQEWVEMKDCRATMTVFTEHSKHNEIPVTYLYPYHHGDEGGFIDRRNPKDQEKLRQVMN